MIVTDEMVEKPKGTKQSISLLKWKSTKSITIDTNHGSNRARHRKDIFTNFTEYPSTGYVLTSAQDAMTFNNFHEGIHLGVILGLRISVILFF
jgi:hypothetical protein